LVIPYKEGNSHSRFPGWEFDLIFVRSADGNHVEDNAEIRGRPPRLDLR
jgi:hypothetical protein